MTGILSLRGFKADCDSCYKEKFIGELYYLTNYETMLCCGCLKELQIGSVVVTGTVERTLQDKIDGVDDY